ncbi:MAG: hypothetical protein IPM56_10720 [Ignavibacteriales bacterium]|nr:MAG: hypothetical protein IPM56_10720 [Ignavibacteriales bacterium]
MEENIIDAAKSAIQLRVTSGTISEHTRNAQKITKEWRTACYNLDPSRILFEESVHPEFNERIDIIDREEMTAYELKVSGNNASNEFYKDIVKIIVWNKLKPSNKIKKLIFITVKDGRRFLDKKFIEEYLVALNQMGILVKVIYI